MAKKIYHYDKVTGVYAGSSMARKSPLDKDDVYLIPAFATEKEPIATSGGHVAVFNGKDWVEVDEVSIPKPEIESAKKRDEMINAVKGAKDLDGLKKVLVEILFGEKSGKD